MRYSMPTASVALSVNVRPTRFPFEFGDFASVQSNPAPHAAAAIFASPCTDGWV